MPLPLRALIVLFVALGVGAAAVGTWLAVEALNKGAPSPIPACGPPPRLGQASSLPIPAGQFVSPTVFENFGSSSGSEARISIWSESNTTYYVYLMDASEYQELGWTSNASGSPSHSTWAGPAHDYTWGSGPVTSANHTSLVGNGDGYVVLYNPGSSVEAVELTVGSCNAPNPPSPPAPR
ncbi:MAG TPA: hypothetical protein VGS23_08185 [Thermoplasmata archaeon]|nr:hypothetical protein [Thermoplasmata archaeon]